MALAVALGDVLLPATALAAQAVPPSDPPGATGATVAESAGGPQPSSAAPVPTSEAAPTGTGIEDIVVTARRRAESLQAVPVAASAFNAQTLVRRSITDIRSFAQSVPSLSVTQSGSSASATIVNIRGQEGTNISMAFDPAVGIYIDEVYLARSLGNQLSTLTDVEGVEVLRGVQGTLFGRNSNGGALVIRPNKPDVDAFAASGLASYGSHNRVMVQGMVNVPLVEGKLAARVSGSWLWRDGFQTAPNAGLNDYGERNRGGGRVAVRATPTETLTLDLAYDINHLDERGQLNSTLATPNFYRNSAAGFQIPISRGTGQGVTGKIIQDFGSVQAKAILAYRTLRFTDRSDVDATISPSLDVFQFKRQRQFSAEVNVNASLFSGGETFNSLDLTSGAFYFVEKGREPRRTPITSTTTVGTIQNGENIRNESKAGYAQLEGKFFDTLALFAGARYTEDARRYRAQIISGGTCRTIPGATLDNCFRLNKAKFDYWSYTVGARYSFTSRAQVYAKYSRGNRSGGLDNNTALLFRPEVVKEVEGGLKVDWFDQTLRTNLAVFRNRFTDIQRSGIQIVNNIPTATVTNAASASIKGVELEATLVPVRGLTFGGSLGYLDAGYKSYLVPQANGTILDLTAARFQNVPKWTYSLSGEYVVNTDVGEFSARADWGHRGRTFLESTSDPVFQQRAFGILNGRLSYSPSRSIIGTGMTFAAFATNLTNKKYLTGATRFAPGNGVVYPTSEPRIIGVEVSARF